MAVGETALRKELGLRDLVLFNVAAIVSTRWIAAAAHVGSGSLLLWAAAAAFFLVPSALVCAHLAKLFPEQGGLYIWTREAFGEQHAFTCAWFYYTNNLFWVPGAIVAFISMFTSAFSSAKLAEDPWFVVPIALAILIVVIAVNYRGLHVAKWVDNLGGIAAYSIWIGLVLAAVAMVVRHGPVTSFHLLPAMDLAKLNFWSQLAFAMTGLELSPIMSGEIRDAKRAIRRAIWISAVLVVLFYIFGTAAILAFVRPADASPIIGLAQAGQQASAVLGWHWVPILIGVGILLSMGGQLGTYIGACARLPFVLGIGNLLPTAFAKLHPKYGTPSVSILFLGAGAAVLLLVSQMGESFRAAYQITVDISVITLFIPFLYIFAAGWRFGQRWASVSGLLVSGLAIVFSTLPTADVKSVFWFEVKVIGGCVLMFVSAILCYRHYRAKAVA